MANNLRIAFTIDAQTGQAVGNIAALQAKIAQIKKSNEELNAKSDYLQKQYGLSAEEARKLAAATDAAAQQAEQLAQEARELAAAEAAAKQEAQALAVATQQAYNQIAQGAGQVSQAVASIFTKGVQAFVEFDSAIRQSGVITSSTGTEAFAGLREEVTRLGIETSKTPQDIAALTVNLSRAGFTAEEQTAALEGLVRASEAAGESLTEVGNIIGITTRVFQYNADETEKVADILVTAANNANTSIPAMGNALAYVGSSAVTANQPLEDISVLLGILGNAGIDASQAGTNLRAMLDRLKVASAGADTQFAGLVRGSKKMTEAYKELAAKTRDAEGNMRPLLEVLPEIRVAMADMTVQDRDILAKALFGVEGGNAFLAIMNASQESIDSLSQKVYNSGGNARKAGEDMLLGLGGALNLLEGSIGAFLVELGEFTAQGVEPAARGAISLINSFLALPPAVKYSTYAFTGLVGAVAAAIGVYSTYQALLIGLKGSEIAKTIVTIKSTAAEVASTAVLNAKTIAMIAANTQYKISIVEMLKYLGALVKQTGASLAAAVASGTLATSIKGVALAAVAATGPLTLMATAIGSVVLLAKAEDLRKASEVFAGMAPLADAAADRTLRLGMESKNLADRMGELARQGAKNGELNKQEIAQASLLIEAAKKKQEVNQQQIESNNETIKSLQKSKTGTAQYDAAIDEQIATLKRANDALGNQNTALEKNRDKLEQAKQGAEAFKKTYEELIAEQEAFYKQQKANIASSLARNQITEDQARKRNLEEEKKYLDERLRLNEQNQRDLEAALKDVDDDDIEGRKKALADITKNEQEAQQLRIEQQRNADDQIIAQNEATLKRITDANDKADRAIEASARARETAIAQELGQREQAIFEALQQGLITQEEYDRQLEAARTASAERGLQAEIEASNAKIEQAKKEIDQIIALRQQGVISTEEAINRETTLRTELATAQQERTTQELALSQQRRDAAIAAIEAERAAFIASIDSQIAANERKTAAIEANADREAAARDRVNAALEREQNLLNARAGLAAAVNESEQQAIQFKIDGITRAIEIQQQLDSGQITSAEQRKNLESELASLGVNSQTKILDLVRQKQAQEDNLAKLKQAALVAEQAQQTALLELEIQRNSLADQRAIAEANVNAALAQQAVLQANLNLQKAKTPDEVANAQQALDIANQQVEAAAEKVQIANENAAVNQKGYEIERQTLETKQETARRAAEQKEKQRELNQQTELTRAKEEDINRAKDKGKAKTQEQGKAQQGVTQAAAQMNTELDKTEGKIDRAADAASGLKDELKEAAKAAGEIGDAAAKAKAGEESGKTVISGGSSPLYTKAQQDAFDFLLPEAQRAIEEAKKRLQIELDLDPETKAILTQIANTDNLVTRVGPDNQPIDTSGRSWRRNALMTFTKDVVNEEAARTILKLAQQAEEADKKAKERDKAADEAATSLKAVGDAADEAATKGLYNLAQALNEIEQSTSLDTPDKVADAVERATARTLGQSLSLEQLRTNLNSLGREASPTIAASAVATGNRGIEERLDKLIANTEDFSKGTEVSIGTVAVSSPDPAGDASKVVRDLVANANIRGGL